MKFDSIIIGAGISGLVAAYRLKKLGRDVLLIESSPRIGGAIHSQHVGGFGADGFLIEAGPNSFRGSHELIDLIEELNLTDELVMADPRAPAYVYSGGQLHAVPMGPAALIKTKLISTSAKLRLLKEPFVKTLQYRDRQEAALNEESIASFVTRRLGKEVLEKLVAPFLSGVYAGDPERLSVQACFPKLAEFEAEAGSILLGALKAARRKQKKSKRSLRPYRLCSFRNGLNTVPLRLAEELGDGLLTAARVTTIRQSPSGFDLTVEHQNESR
ncbi:MAG: protoporphyrinogen oxidase, partial [Acidobacteriota bacterium]